jgi:hypothetical protein
LTKNYFDVTTEGFDRYAAGQDYGLNITFAKIGLLCDVKCVIGDYGAFNMATQSFNDELSARGLLTCPDEMDLPVYCAPVGSILSGI